MRFLDRREFLQQSAGLSALISSGALIGNATAGQQAPPAPNNRGGANERLKVAVIGVKGRGRAHIQGFAGQNNCVITHLCDVDTAVVGPAVQLTQKRQGSEPQVVQDLRRIMDDKTIDIVAIATPNHWHALAAIWAMRAGKHVYVEKPVSHNVSEGKRIVEAARHYNKICQAGTQIRSQAPVRQAIEYLHAGSLGKLTVARGLCYKSRPSIGRCNGPQQPPRTMDYNLWCGPASNRPPHRNHPVNGTVHYDWHWVWEYGNGDLGNQGIHQMDVARWGLNKNELSRSIISLGGRFGYTDDGETPNTQVSIFDYGDAELIFEVRGLRTDPYRAASVGNVFHCANGYLVFPNYSAAIAYDNNNREIRRFEGGGDTGQHFANFVNAVRSGRREDLNGDIQEGHVSSALCHLANISYRLGRAVPFDRRDGVLGDNRDANESLTRMVEHLRGNMVALDSTNLTVGRRLTVDVAAETFGNDQEANRFLTREYRKGFELPTILQAAPVGAR